MSFLLTARLAAEQLARLETLLAANVGVAEIAVGKPPTRQQLADDLGEATTNAIGTLIGEGVGGQGAKLWRDRNDEIRVCVENVVRIIGVCDPDDVRAVLDELGLDQQSLRAKLAAMPRATKQPS
jgi:hypothetical protein